MKIKSIIDWLKAPMSAWPMGLMGIAIVAIGIYDLISAFYVNHIGDLGTPTALQAIFAALLVGFGAACTRLCTKRRNRQER